MTPLLTARQVAAGTGWSEYAVRTAARSGDLQACRAGRQVRKPLAIDLFCGLGGWSSGFLAEGYDVIGFDIERHVYGTQKYPAQLVLQDVLTLHGSQFRDAACIVASPPCQCYSYMAMPWTRAKKMAAEYRDGTRSVVELNALFDACFRIQREAILHSTCPTCSGYGSYPNPQRDPNLPLYCQTCKGSGKRRIPLIVENVKGAQPWVGRAAWHYGSFYLWGDVPAIMPWTGNGRMKSRIAATGKRFDERTASTPEEADALHYRLPAGQKNSGGSWFGIGSPGQKETGMNPVNGEGVKQHGSGALDERRREATATKNGNDWFGAGENCSLQRRASSRSSARKAASAQIAKIPETLARHIARCYKPTEATRP